MYGYEWTEEYGIFRLTIDTKIQKEIRPVFHEELDFFGIALVNKNRTGKDVKSRTRSERR